MLEEQKKMIELQISILKEIMRQEGLIFGFLIDKKDESKSSLAIIPKKNIKKDLKKGRVQLSLRKDVFNDLDYKTIDPLKPYILTISTGKEVLMTYIYFSRL